MFIDTKVIKLFDFHNDIINPLNTKILKPQRETRFNNNKQNVVDLLSSYPKALVE